MNRNFYILLGLCTALLCIPLWTVAYLPMVDLPQHAAQIKIWSHWNDLEYAYQAIYDANWFTPYLFGYSLLYVLQLIFPIKIAIKVLICAALISVPWSLAVFVRRMQGNLWWVFGAFPALLGYSFSWGFVNFLIGTPLVLLFLALVEDYAQNPSLRRGVWVALSACGLFFAHLLLLGFGMLIGTLIILAHAPSFTHALKYSLCFLPALPFAALWLVLTRSSQASAQQLVVWNLRASRFKELVGESVGEIFSLKALALAVIVFFLPWLLGGRPRKSLLRFAPFVACALLVLIFPTELFGTAFVNGRFGVFLFPMWLYAWEPAPSRLRPLVQQSIGPLLVSGWIATLTLNFWSFERETRGYDVVASQIPKQAKVLYLPVINHSLYVRGPVFLHFAQWSQGDHGGSVDFSFAQYFPQVFHYKSEVSAKRVPLDFEWFPMTFDWKRNHAEEYDYFLVRAPQDMGAYLFRSATTPIRLVAHSQLWWLYSRAAPTP